MSKYKAVLLLVCGLALSASSLNAQKNELNIHTINGPALAKLGNVGQIQVPAGFEFMDGPTLQRVLKAMGEPAGDNSLGRIAPASGDWAVFFSFSDVGYVKDDEKNSLDADKLLRDYQRGTEEGNKIRKQSGMPPIHIIGWQQPPKYDETTHNLQWSIKASREGEQILNFDTRLLGRHGVMEVTLAVDPKDFEAVLPAYNQLMAGFGFTPGQTYGEYRKGDKVAKYGLAALITAGAAVGAAKLGLFAWLAVMLKKGFKLIIVAVVAVLAMLKKFFARLFGRSSDSPTN